MVAQAGVGTGSDSLTGTKDLFGVKKMSQNSTAVMHTQNSVFTKSHWIIHFTLVNFLEECAFLYSRDKSPWAGGVQRLRSRGGPSSNQNGTAGKPHTRIKL